MQAKLRIGDERREGDIVTAVDGSIDSDDGIETAIAISLFTDRLATESDGAHVGEDRRGWWFDALDSDPTTRTGSRLWLLESATLTDETLRRAEDYANEALVWMVDEGVARSVETKAARAGDEAAQMTTTVTRAEDGSPYSITWELHYAVR